jgi:hypothetical protein
MFRDAGPTEGGIVMGCDVEGASGECEWVECGVEVVNVCWRHTTKPDGTKVVLFRGRV